MTFRYPILILCLLSAFVNASAQEDSILESINSADDPVERIEAYIGLGDSFEYSDPAKAITYFEKAFEEGTEVRATLRGKNALPQVEMLRAKSLRYKGIVLSDQGKYDEALETYAMARQILDEVRGLYTSLFRREVDLKIAKLLNNIGIVYSRQGVFGLAKEYYLEALAIHQELEDENSIAITYSSLGIIEARQANMSEALKYFQEALQIFTNLDNIEGKAQSFNNIGGIFFQLGNWSEALELYNKAHEAYMQLGHKQRVAAILGNIGLVYQNLADFEKAREYMQRSLEIRIELNDQGGIVESYNNMGALFSELKQYGRASEFYQQSYELAQTIGDPRILSISLINIGRSYSQAGDHVLGIEYTLKGLEIAQQHNLKFVVSDALEQLAGYYAAAQDYNNAYDFARKHYLISQEILDEQKARQINELEIEFKAREKQQRIEILEQEKELSRLQMRQSETLAFVLGLLFIVAIIVGIFTFLLINQRNKILLLKKEHEAKSIIRKTDNDLQAILKTHAHAMILFDIELKVVAFNILASDWSEKFLMQNLSFDDSFYESNNPLINELVNDILSQSMKGVSRKVEKDFYSTEKKKYYFKFFSSPVFDDNDQSIQSISLMIEDITDRRTSEARILSDLHEKETLVKEIHHRVKNNMQVIISLIRLQYHEIKDEKSREAFRDLEQRITAMSYVHEELYKSPNLANINFDEYLEKISNNLISIYNKSVKVNNYIFMDNHLVDIDIAVPCGLIVNELLTNSLKHAFAGQDHTAYDTKIIDVFFTEKENSYELRVNDNGVGMIDDYDLDNISTMGFHLVKIIAEDQLRGSWKIASNEGLKVTVEFPRK